MKIDFYLLILSIIFGISQSNQIFFSSNRVPLLEDDTIVEVSDSKVKTFRTITNLGKRLVIKLHGDIACTYGWYLNNNVSGIRDILIPKNMNSLKAGQFVVNKDKHDEILKDGYFYFIFIPVKVGQVELSFTHRKPFEFKSKKGREIKVKVRVLKDFGDNDELSRHLNKGRKGGKKGKGGKGRKGWRFNKKPHKFHHKYNKYKSRHHRIEW